MKEIKELGYYKIDGKDVILVGSEYKGSPIICWKYSVLIGPKKVIRRYNDELLPKHFGGHKITVKYI